jgi:hypothetical protein
MNDPGEVMIAIASLTAVVISIKAIATAVLRYQENKLKLGASAVSTVTDARLERMEHAVDAIAIEIERISEGQRFTTRLLSERATTSR